MRRLSVYAIAAALLLSLAAVAPALAAASNDTVADALAVSVGSTTNEDTTVADTTDPTETALNEFCGSPVVEHGVWFTVTPSADTFVAFDTTGSDYTAGVMLFFGAPTAEGLIDCGPGRIIDFIGGGETMYVLVFGDGLSTATSGNLSFEVRAAVAPPDISLTLNRFGTVDKSGTVHVWGTPSCTSSDGSGHVVGILGEVTQRVGRILIRASFENELFIPCDGTAQRWDAFFTSANAIFAGGKAATFAIGVGCTDLCSNAFVQQTIQLKRSGK